jgi:hypothetical protein
MVMTSDLDADDRMVQGRVQDILKSRVRILLHKWMLSNFSFSVLFFVIRGVK